jgi:hypothetical protein
VQDGGLRLAAEHNQRRQQRNRPSGGSAAGPAGGRQQPQQEQLGGSPQPGGGGRGRPGAATGGRQGDVDEDAHSKHIGRLRLASRKAVYREPTPGALTHHCLQPAGRGMLDHMHRWLVAVWDLSAGMFPFIHLALPLPFLTLFSVCRRFG